MREKDLAVTFKWSIEAAFICLSIPALKIQRVRSGKSGTSNRDDVSKQLECWCKLAIIYFFVFVVEHCPSMAARGSGLGLQPISMVFW